MEKCTTSVLVYWAGPLFQDYLRNHHPQPSLESLMFPFEACWDGMGSSTQGTLVLEVTHLMAADPIGVKLPAQKLGLNWLPCHWAGTRSCWQLLHNVASMRTFRPRNLNTQYDLDPNTRLNLIPSPIRVDHHLHAKFLIVL